MFLEELASTGPLYIVSKVETCQHCGRPMEVHALMLQSWFRPEEGENEFDANECFVLLSNCVVEDARIVKAVEAITQDLATDGHNVLLTHCPHCKTPQDYDYLFAEPGAAFHPEDYTWLQSIQIRRVEITPPFALFGGFATNEHLGFRQTERLACGFCGKKMPDGPWDYLRYPVNNRFERYACEECCGTFPPDYNSPPQTN